MKENLIRNEATKILLRYFPEKSYLELYNSEAIAPGGVFHPEIHLIARIKIELAKKLP